MELIQVAVLALVAGYGGWRLGILERGPPSLAVEPGVLSSKNPGLPFPHVHTWHPTPYIVDPSSGKQLQACVDPKCNGVLKKPIGRKAR